MLLHGGCFKAPKTFVNENKPILAKILETLNNRKMVANMQDLDKTWVIWVQDFKERSSTLDVWSNYDQKSFQSDKNFKLL